MSALEFSSQDNEPFLRLLPALDNFILTPPRSSDGEPVVESMNDPRVYNYLIGPPFPYPRSDWDKWYPAIVKGCQRSLELYYPNAPYHAPEVELQGGESGDAGQAPVRIIRETDPMTAKQTFVGDVVIRKSTFSEILDKNEKERLKNENDSLPTADKKIIYDIGCKLRRPYRKPITDRSDFLVPSYHGRGIMTWALRTLLQKFAIPDLNVHHITGIYFGHNIASKRVFEKNGFIYRETVPNGATLPESKGGRKVDLGVLTWTRREDQ